ncbi:hypothetical protein [Listeria seeligeri]|uniref:hypothetical protein n=1 Tax=Listeria seeligeri TaxID=1640 RepID=UPI0018882F0C|nr:hypothetical protein [Listeria seeligeri]MBF2629988.1 hypothetical protein [Listeria seeligeri]
MKKIALVLKWILLVGGLVYLSMVTFLLAYVGIKTMTMYVLVLVCCLFILMYYSVVGILKTTREYKRGEKFGKED